MPFGYKDEHYYQGGHCEQGEELDGKGDAQSLKELLVDDATKALALIIGASKKFGSEAMRVLDQLALEAVQTIASIED